MPRHVPARIYRRVPFETAVRLELDRFHGFVEQYSANLSLGGMFIASDEQPPPGTEVTVEFRLGDGFELIRGRGRVVWVREAGDDEPAGFGLRFLELTPGSRELIFRLVERRVREGDRVFDVDEEAPGRPEAAAGAGDGEVLTAPPWELPPPRAGEEPRAAAGSSASTVAAAGRFGRAARELGEPAIEPSAPAPAAADPEVSFAGLVDDDAAAGESTVVDEAAVDPSAAAWSAVRSLESVGGAAGAEAEQLSGGNDEADGSLGASATAGSGRDEAPARWGTVGSTAGPFDDPGGGAEEIAAWPSGGLADPAIDEGSIEPSASLLVEREGEAAAPPARGTGGSAAAPFTGAEDTAGGEVSTGRSPSPLDETKGEAAVPPAWGTTGSGATSFRFQGAETTAGGELLAARSTTPSGERGGQAAETSAWGTAGTAAAPFHDESVAAGGTERSEADTPWPWASPLPETENASPSLTAETVGDEPERPARSWSGRVAVAAAVAGLAAVAVAGVLWLSPGDGSKAAVASPPAARPAPLAAADGAAPPPAAAAESATAVAPPRPSPAAASAVAPPPAASGRAGTIESIVWQRRAGGVEFEIAGAGPIPAAAVDHYTVGGERPRLVVGIGGVERPYARSEIAVGEGPVERVRTGFHPAAGADAGELRVVFDLAVPAEATVETSGGRVRVRFEGG